MMGSLRARLGRREGVRGYLTDQMLNKVEKVSAMSLNTFQCLKVPRLYLEKKKRKEKENPSLIMSEH